ncbi:sulfatase [Singulisphaera acidiphila]|uniref:Arylsulfatase A family protein n=2 Tax=Singulisphaera acidiphila TaxID=466153 RepID=L0D712_SINAD|nr:sulfatase [Singulisphaera acidiphila]AGA24665.1 arylsulfatase A family protein [Singulisphaera acidiphila DSM 18658]
MDQPGLECADRKWDGSPSVLAWAVWLGLVAGILELVALILKCNYLDPRNYNVSRHFPWMYPVSGVLVLLGPGLVLAVAAWAWPRWLSKSAAVGGLVFFASLSVLFRAPIYTVACLVLAAGGGLQIARLIRARPGSDRLVRWTLGPLVGLLVVTIALSYGRSTWLQRQALATAQPTAPRARTGGAKNVVLIVLDTVRAQSLSLYGYGRKTSPNLERIAAEGVRFDQALATAPWTAPSHAGMFTGQLPGQLSIGWSRPLDGTYTTLAEFLGARGYRTAGFVANTTYCSYETGLDRGFHHYEDYDVSLPNILLCSGLMQRTLNFVRNATGLGLDDIKLGGGHRKDAARINRDFLGWLASRPAHDSPYFAFLNYYDAHHPYLTPEPDQERPRGRQPRSSADFNLLRKWWDLDKKGLTSTDLELVRDSYDRCLTYLDDQIGRLFKELTKRGELEDTIVIVTADHGEHLGEQRLYGHGCSLYRPELHVPLLVFAPGAVPTGQVVTAPVSLRDLPATVVDLLGLANESPFPGRSLAVAWSGGPVPAGSFADSLLSEVELPPEADPNGGRSPVCRGPMLSLVADGWHYIRNGDGREELYDFEHDTAETNDLAGSADKAEVMRTLRARIAEGSDPGRPVVEGPVPKAADSPARLATRRSSTTTKGL